VDFFDGEDKYLIDYYFSQNHELGTQLKKLNRLMLNGDNTEAKWMIKRLKKRASASLKAILDTYTANLLFVESKFEESLTLARKIQPVLDGVPRYQNKARNIELKIYTAVFKDKQKVDSLFTICYKRGQAQNDLYNLGWSLHYKAIHLNRFDNYNASNRYFKRAIKIQRLAHDLKGLSASLSWVGSNYAKLNQFNLAIDYLHKSITIRRKHKNWRGLANSYLNLNNVYRAMGEYAKLISTEKKSMAICLKFNDYDCVIGRYVSIGLIRLQHNDVYGAQRNFIHALNLNNRLKSKHLERNTIFFGLAKCELKLGDVKKSQAYLDSISIERSNLSLNQKSDFFLTQAQIKDQQGDSKVALIYADSAKVYAEEVDDLQLKSDAYFLLKRLFDASGDYKHALVYFTKYFEVSKQMESTAKSKWLMQKEIQFSLKKRQDYLINVEKRKKEIASAKTKNQRIISVVLGFGLLATIGLFIYIVRLYKDRNKTQRNLLDLTEQNAQLTRQMASQEVFAVIGEIAASVAHDLNTPLGAIKAGAENVLSLLASLFGDSIDSCSAEQLKKSFQLAEKSQLELFVGGLQIRKETAQMENYLLELNKDIEQDDLKTLALSMVKARIQISETALIQDILAAPNRLDYIQLIWQAKNLFSLLKTVLTSSERARDVVLNIRQQIQANTEHEPVEINIRENIEDVLNVFSHLFKDGLTLNFDVDPKLYIAGDPIKLYQLWSNLIKNAIEASPVDGLIEITSSCDSDSFSISIANAGPVIPAEDIHRIFDRFYSTKKSKNGTGLGLSIVKKMAEIHHAKISIASENNKTIFTIKFNV